MVGNDLIKGGVGNDEIYGGEGNDTLYGGVDDDIITGDGGIDTIFGDDGNDNIDGGADDDFISGGLGNDTLTGGIGNDAVYGGEGNDNFIYIYRDNIGAFDEYDGGKGSDKLSVYFTSAEYALEGVQRDLLFYKTDRFVNDNAGFANNIIYSFALLGLIIQEIENMDIFVDDQLQTISFNSFLGSELDEIIIGSSSEDVALGNEGDDLIQGLAGDDDLRGGSGADTIEAGDGVDTVYGDLGDDIITGEGGSDRLFGGKGDDIISGGADNDYIEGDKGNDTISGDFGDDLLVGGEGDDTLTGGIGSDILLGGKGNDNLNGGEGSDLLVYNEADGVSGNDIIDGGTGFDILQLVLSDSTLTLQSFQDDLVDLKNAISNQTTYYMESLGLTVSNIEVVDIHRNDGKEYSTLIAVDDFIEVNQDQSITFTDLMNNDLHFEQKSFLITEVSQAIHGAITLNHENTITYLSDIDYFGEDSFIYSVLDSDGNISTATVSILVQDVLEDTILTITGTSSSDILSGTSGDDIIKGLEGNDTLDGLGGDDKFIYLSGNDTFNGGEDSDTADFSNFDKPVWVKLDYNGIEVWHRNGQVLTSGTWEAFVDLNSIENFIGTNFSDILIGDSNNNIFTGLDGNDNIEGYAGDDIIYGGLGDDDLDGGAGIDTLSYANSLSAITLDLRTNNATGEGNDTINNFEVIVGSSHDDEITGSESGTDTLYGGAGNDNIYARNGNDIVYAGEGDDYINAAFGNDVLYGDEGNDHIIGAQGNDIIHGGTGDDLIIGREDNDVIYGGAGSDELHGGSGVDSFVFEAVTAFEGVDTIKDFNQFNEIIDISDVLSGYDNTVDTFTDFVQMIDNGANSVLSIDVDGGADNYVQIAVIEGVTGLTDEVQLVSNGTLIV